MVSVNSERKNSAHAHEDISHIGARLKHPDRSRIILNKETGVWAKGGFEITSKVVNCLCR